jgi:hypothetical protein
MPTLERSGQPARTGPALGRASKSTGGGFKVSDQTERTGNKEQPMADNQGEGREGTWRQLLSWTELFRGFQVALDINKLLLAAAGILAMALGWWLLALVFSATKSSSPPTWVPDSSKTDQGWADFRAERHNWNLMHQAANLAKGSDRPRYEVQDIAETLDEYEYFKDLNSSDAVTEHRRTADVVKAFQNHLAALKKQGLKPELLSKYQAKERQYALLGRVKPAGLLVVGPWYEDRGPNPYLLITGQAGIPWEPGHFWEWFLRDQALVMIEPLVNLVRPIIYFFSPTGNTFGSRVYFLAVLAWTLLVWSFFGGAITRIAAVQLARGEKIGLFEAVRFTLKRWLAYVMAPAFPLVIVLFLMVLMMLFGLVVMIPYFGDIFVAGPFWPIMLVFGLVIAVALVGLVGWPMMSATVSTEGTDAWEAVSRSYSYVFQRPWNYAWYAAVGIVYGAVLVFFVGFMGSLTVYMSKWGVSLTAKMFYEKDNSSTRVPSYLFVYAPTSFGWRELLLEGTTSAEGNVVEDRASRERIQGPGAGGVNRWDRINPEAYESYVDGLSWGQKLGAIMVAFWLGLLFLLVLGFGYSYFWTASTIIYLLMRRNVDAAEMDEVYLEEDDLEGPWTPPAATAPAALAKPSHPLPVVEHPLRPPAPPPMVVDEPVVDEPVVDEPVVDKPVVDTSVVERPATDARAERPASPTSGTTEGEKPPGSH